ncbi:hypothetical protein EBAPG3_007075 [Nitrosospira lacus]|uniref:DUF1090 domain-containing protein n=1 Tax=Nitrosospira lacus TaxID=1288494 RepID=A0A1W6SNZ9_9PROT|nr:hypothetical protein [Nitrosospira lacus]ARO87549.1 hypothetical protein EBAPG3_007075 [Nitrosospira lacus]
MKWNAFSTQALAFLTMSVLAQRAPGNFRTGQGYQEAQAPGRFREDGNPTCETETSRLEALVESQKKKISLLEAKIKLLEAELQKQKGANQ